MIFEMIKFHVYICTCIHTHTHMHSISSIYVYTHCIYTHNGILIIKKSEILPFVTKYVDLEGIMLSEVSQAKTSKSALFYLFF